MEGLRLCSVYRAYSSLNPNLWKNLWLWVTTQRTWLAAEAPSCRRQCPGWTLVHWACRTQWLSWTGWCCRRRRPPPAPTSLPRWSIETRSPTSCVGRATSGTESRPTAQRTPWTPEPSPTNLHHIHTQVKVTRRVAVYPETHCNIGSKRAFSTGVLRYSTGDTTVYVFTDPQAVKMNSSAVCIHNVDTIDEWEK